VQRHAGRAGQTRRGEYIFNIEGVHGARDISEGGLIPSFLIVVEQTARALEVCAINGRTVDDAAPFLSVQIGQQGDKLFSRGDGDSARRECVSAIVPDNRAIFFDDLGQSAGTGGQHRQSVRVVAPECSALDFTVFFSRIIGVMFFFGGKWLVRVCRAGRLFF
jgi:hypothetical protein